MELVERYVQAVKNYLPKSKKEEIARELRANILDDIDAKEAEQGRAINTQELSALLSMQGHPQKVAQAYSPQYPLVASEDMPLYKSIMIKALLLLFVFALISAGRYLVEAQSVNAFAYLFVAVGSFIENIGVVLIIVTGGFYYLSKEGHLEKWRYSSWSPESLPKANAQIIKKSDSLWEVTVGVFGLLILWTPIWMNESTYNSLALGFADGMEQWRIILTFFVGYSLLSAIYRLTKTYWTKQSIAIYIAEYIAYIALALYLTTLPQLVAINNPQFAELTPIISNIFKHIWYGAAFIWLVIAASLVRKWFKV